MAQLYDHSLMSSTTIQNAPFSLIVPFSHSEQSPKALKRLFQPKADPPSRTPCPGQPQSNHDSLCRHGLLSRIDTESAYPFQHFTEHVPGHHHLSKLEYKPPGMTHQSPSYLNEPGLNTCQRPALYRFWQSQPSEEVAQVISQNEQR